MIRRLFFVIGTIISIIIGLICYYKIAYLIAYLLNYNESPESGIIVVSLVIVTPFSFAILLAIIMAVGNIIRYIIYGKINTPFMDIVSNKISYVWNKIIQWRDYKKVKIKNDEYLKYMDEVNKAINPWENL